MKKVMEIPTYDAGGRVKKYAVGGEVEEWEPILEDDTDERTLEMKDEALEGDKKSILDIIKDRINIGIEPKKGKSKKSKPSKKKDKPKTKEEDIGPVDFDPDNPPYEDLA